MTKTIKTTLAAAILGIAFAGYSHAQTPTPSPAPVPTNPLTAAMAAQGNTFKASGNWAGLISTMQPEITSSYVYTPGEANIADAQSANNLAIQFVVTAIRETAGIGAAHTYALQENAFMTAANYSFIALHNPAQAVTESGEAVAASAPANAEWTAQNLFYQVRAGQAGNTQVVGLLNAQTSLISQAAGNWLYQAYNPVGAAKSDLRAFYQTLVQSVENNTANAAFIGKILDQINKLDAQQ